MHKKDRRHQGWTVSSSVCIHTGTVYTTVLKAWVPHPGQQCSWNLWGMQITRRPFWGGARRALCYRPSRPFWWALICQLFLQAWFPNTGRLRRKTSPKDSSLSVKETVFLKTLKLSWRNGQSFPSLLQKKMEVFFTDGLSCGSQTNNAG